MGKKKKKKIRQSDHQEIAPGVYQGPNTEQYFTQLSKKELVKLAQALDAMLGQRNRLLAKLELTNEQKRELGRWPYATVNQQLEITIERQAREIARLRADLINLQ